MYLFWYDASKEYPMYRSSIVRKLTGIDNETLRMWHKRRQLLTDEDMRQEFGFVTGKWREYSIEDIVRIAAILRLSESGLTIGEVRAMQKPLYVMVGETPQNNTEGLLRVQPPRVPTPPNFVLISRRDAWPCMELEGVGQWLESWNPLTILDLRPIRAEILAKLTELDDVDLKRED